MRRVPSRGMTTVSAPSSPLCLTTALAAIACVVGPRSLAAQDHAAAEPGEAPRIAVWTDDRDVLHRSDRVPVFFRSATDDQTHRRVHA